MSDLSQSLTRLFDRRRIVFWYDDKQELRAEFDAVDLPAVEKIVLANNQFGVKHRILRQEPEGKFLLYHAGPRPANLDNWLLDVELAHITFAADQTALWLSELGLGLEFVPVVRPHAAFFGAEGRRAALQKLLTPDDTARTLRLKMVAVCVSAEPRLDEILEALLVELAGERDEKMRLVERSGLDGFLWQDVERTFGYTSATPTIKDFGLSLFKAGYAQSLGEPAALSHPGEELTPDALVFLKRWQNNRRISQAFTTLSQLFAQILDIESELHRRELRALLDLDLFELIDRKILVDLVQAVAARTLSAAECEESVRRRRQSHWYAQHAPAYEAIACAAHFFQALDSVDLTVHSLAHGIQQYSRVWFRLDQLYRKFVYYARQSAQPTLLAPLTERVENLYTNNYLLKVNDLWQPLVDAAPR